MKEGGIPMPKMNRGDTTKMSIKLSTPARQNIEVAAKKYGLSKGGIILFELSKLLKNPPSKTDILNLENEVTLERTHFVLTTNRKLADELNQLARDYDMKKNVLFGLMVSKHFEENFGDLDEPEQTDPKQLKVDINEELKKKILKYSEENFVPVSGIVSYSVLEGPYEALPEYESTDKEIMFTRVPEYIFEEIKQKAYELNMREHFYVGLCLYKQFMTKEGRFSE
jgi:hypothetical protein